METPEAIAALLYAAQNSSPFSGSNALYSNVKFKRGYQKGSMEVSTVALYESGGAGARKGLGTVDHWRQPRIIVDILAENRMEAIRIAEKVRAAWQADYNCEGGGDVGDVGNGYIREAGIKDLNFSEVADAPWDDTGMVSRVTFSVTIKIAD